MDCSVQHKVWVEQVDKLRTSVADLSETEPTNVLKHFFNQASESELSNELGTVKSMAKLLICTAMEMGDRLTGTIRQKSVLVLRTVMQQPILRYIRLADIRNRAVFEVYKQCGITIDTYFDRYSSPPGSADQSESYSLMAHGSAQADASNTEILSNVLLYMQILKRFFTVRALITTPALPTSARHLNWIGAMWASHVQEMSLGDLVWELFLDVWYYEHFS